MHTLIDPCHPIRVFPDSFFSFCCHAFICHPSNRPTGVINPGGLTARTEHSIWSRTASAVLPMMIPGMRSRSTAPHHVALILFSRSHTFLLLGFWESTI